MSQSFRPTLNTCLLTKYFADPADNNKDEDKEEIQTQLNLLLSAATPTS